MIHVVSQKYLIVKHKILITLPKKLQGNYKNDIQEPFEYSLTLNNV